MENQPKPQNSVQDDGSFYSRSRDISAIGLAGLALAVFLFWVAAEVRWDNNTALYTCNVMPPTSRPAPQTTSNYVRVNSNSVNDNRCENIDERIDWLNSRLRAGYRVAEGERYKQELRDLKKEKYDKCR